MRAQPVILWPEKGGPTVETPAGSLSLAQPRGGQIGEHLRRGTGELLRAYSELPWLRSVVSRISDAVASLE